MLTVFIEGGLGNQLFMVFALLAYGFKHDAPIYFEKRPITTGTRKKTYWDTLLQPLQPYIEDKTCNHGYREPAFHYTEIPEQLKTMDIRLHGYYQSYRYFDYYKGRIFALLDLEKQKSELLFRLPPRSWTATVSMHFRLGDYKNLSQYHNIQPLEYYKNALSCLPMETSWNVLYFCELEDIGLVNAKVDVLREWFPYMTFERMDVTMEDWEEMLAMSLCRHHIIANSSFSYFGAYFDGRSDSQVYYPSQWFGPALASHNLKDLCPPHWVKVQS